jgi:hypothetical protein
MENVMELRTHDRASLLAQLGQASDGQAMARFVAGHRPLPGNLRLHDASFWTPAQAAFLREAMLEDGAWSDVVDQLNRELHAA